MPRPPEKKRSNLRDVAAHAGVSVATVSRVLNASGRVSPETRARVQAAIAELRFRPLAAARAINSGRSRMIGALLPSLDNSTYARVIDGLEARLAEHDLSLMVARTGEDRQVELARARQLLEAGAEGLFLAGRTRAPALLELIAHYRLPAIMLAYWDPDGPIPSVSYDNVAAVAAAADHLRGLGHREIAVIHGPRATNDRTAQRLETLAALGDGLRYAPFETELSFAGGAAAARRIAQARGPATAALCFSDMLAMGAMAGFQSAGLVIPRDMSVLGIEDLPAAAATHPPLTSVRLQVQRMGEEAGEAMARWVETGERPAPLCLDCELIVRASTAPPRG
ncbi:LacI family DNA-binding transcriptional regulator [Jannaschia seohaensis]|uniref:LacI family transcriptional regulator n=1 Tax=Jannaschia seohaensis TaxID=475081 RepID=A0A2Y9B269_9RHOB|nr:LacI family DNA-binding transcriptional regulator [Jannaschia seohaensis]PWJ13304.1 LacI family transcriptional regulator [Jannaschia seohaensis]SSA50630.1 LacI family transcriptional regulator [Jannaschia seohaensis]